MNSNTYGFLGLKTRFLLSSLLVGVKKVYSLPMLSKLKWDWIFFGAALLYSITGLITHTNTLYVGSIYCFSLALRIAPRFVGREAVPIVMLVALLYVVETTPFRGFTESMIYTLQSLILFRAILLEMKSPELYWFLPMLIEFVVNVVLVYASIKPIHAIPGIEYAVYFPGRILVVVVGVQLWCRLKNSLILKKPS